MATKVLHPTVILTEGRDRLEQLRLHRFTNPEAITPHLGLINYCGVSLAVFPCGPLGNLNEFLNGGRPPDDVFTQNRVSQYEFSSRFYSGGWNMADAFVKQSRRLVSALKFLYEIGLPPTDLKPESILISKGEMGDSAGSWTISHLVPPPLSGDEPRYSFYNI